MEGRKGNLGDSETQNVRKLFIFQGDRFICSSLWKFFFNNFVISKRLTLGFLILKNHYLKKMITEISKQSFIGA